MDECATFIQCEPDPYCTGFLCACSVQAPSCEATVLFGLGCLWQEKRGPKFVAYTLGEDELHLDPCRRRVRDPLSKSHLGCLQNGQNTGRRAEHVLDEAELRWDPYPHREKPTVKHGARKALAMTCSASERAFDATRSP